MSEQTVILLRTQWKICPSAQCKIISKRVEYSSQALDIVWPRVKVKYYTQARGNEEREQREDREKKKSQNFEEK